MKTKPENTVCDHDFEPNLFEAGTEKCVYCPATRETPAEVRAGIDVPMGAVVVHARAA